MNNSLYYPDLEIFKGNISNTIIWHPPPCKKCKKSKDLKNMNSSRILTSSPNLNIFNPMGGGFIISDRVSPPIKCA